MSKIPVWSWRDAIAKAEVPTLTKALCWAISNYLSDAGKGCWPSMASLIRDTGMGERSITTHLKNAADAGLLVARRQRNEKGHLGPYKFHPCFPKTMELQSDIPESEGGVESPENPGAPDASRDEGLGASGAEPRRAKCATSKVSNKEVSKERERAREIEFELPADWSLPDDMRAWATKESPGHAHLVENDAKKFRAHWRGKQRKCSEAAWKAEWEKWWLRTCERPAVAPQSSAGAYSISAAMETRGGVPRDTSEPVPLMVARGIVAGTYTGPVAPRWKSEVERHVADLRKNL